MATTYFGTKPVSDWTPNGSTESGHNFTEQIANQQKDIDAGKTAYNNQQNVLNNAQSEYENAYKNQTGYNDLYNQAKENEGVNQARDQYQKSLNAVNATNTAMSNLPSSINAGSNVVLNSAQRNAALGNQMNKYQNTLAYWQNQNAGDQNMYQTAIASAQDLAGKNMSQEQMKVAQSQQNYEMQMNQLNQLYQNVLNEKNLMRQIYGDMYDDEYNHMQQEIEIWAQNLGAETARYQQEQENYRIQLKLNAEKEANDKAMEWQKYLQAQQEQANKDMGRANDIDAINKIYAQYIGEINDLTKNRSNFTSYLIGENSLFPSMFNGGQTAVMRGDALQNKGFEDYLYNQNPYLQKILREDYGDLLGNYGISNGQGGR